VIVVSDTTPLNYLVLIGAIDVLPKLFQDVYTTHAALAELGHPKAPDAVRAWAASPPAWLKVADPIQRLPSTGSLGPGEAAAISLAKERRITDVLIDERQGSRIARREGLIPLPTLAVIERGREEADRAWPAIDRLRTTSIRISNELYDAALARDAGRKSGT
jgi:predicted nucleic acid-binding protein